MTGLCAGFCSKNVMKAKLKRLPRAIEIKADWLIMDERIGRETARHMNVKVIGLLGCLLAVKQKSIIAEMATPIKLCIRWIDVFCVDMTLKIIHHGIHGTHRIA